jgi:hypothetical protein
VERDEDGITLYFFSSGYTKYEHVTSAEEVRFNFSQERPYGGTQLAEALADAVIPDNLGRPETILVITDGAPDNRQRVEQVITAAAHGLHKSDDLRIVFVQVGDDRKAATWLSTLGSRLGVGDGLDVLPSAQLAKTGLPFAQWVARSIMPDPPSPHHRAAPPGFNLHAARPFSAPSHHSRLRK